MCLIIVAHRHCMQPKSLVFERMVDLSGEESNRLFEVFEEWEAHLASLDHDDLRCVNDNNAP